VAFRQKHLENTKLCGRGGTHDRSRGVKTGGKVAQFPGRRITAGGAKPQLGAPKSLTNFTSTFFDTVNFLPNDLRFEHGGAKLASCLGRCLTSLRPWVGHSKVQEGREITEAQF